MSFISDKISEDLIEMLSQDGGNVLPVIVQMNGSLMDNDEELIGGTIKNRLSIINSYSTELSVKSIKELSSNHRIKKIYYDGEVGIL
jgi:hypothetical protein